MPITSTAPSFQGQGSNHPSFSSEKKSLLNDCRSSNEPVLSRQETGTIISQPQNSNQTPEKSKTRKALDYGNLGLNGLAAGAKLLSATNKLLGLNWSIGNALSSNGELITRTAIIGQAALGLYDAAIEKKNTPAALAQALEIGLVIKAKNSDKWLLRGISQGLLNIVSPITKAYEILQKILQKQTNKNPEESFYADYKSLPFGKALQKSFSIPFNIFKNNIKEIAKKPALLKENLTYALSGAASFMCLGGLLGLTPLKGFASIVRFMGAVPADAIYAVMGHHVEEDYNPKNKFNIKKMFDPKSLLGWAGKFWLPAGIIDPIKRLPSLKHISEPLNDICDAFDRIAAGFYQASLYQKKQL